MSETLNATIAHGEDTMTYREVFESLSEKQKEQIYFMLGAVKKISQAFDDGEFDDVDDDEEVKHSDDGELKHYGVLGMKWGIRRYQNADGSLTDKGKKHYGENGKYEYKSANTKRLEAKTQGLSKALDDAKASGNQTKADRLAKRLESTEGRRKASEILDKAYQDYAKTTSTGKAIAQNLIFGPFGARGYQQSRALGRGRGVSALLGVASGIAAAVRIPGAMIILPNLGNQLVRAGEISAMKRQNSTKKK